MNDEHVTEFLSALGGDLSPVLEEIRETAVRDNVPVIRRETQSFLKTLLFLVKPKRILEAGTGVGFSSCLMAAYAPDDCVVTTIENYEKRIPLARANFRKAGFENRITLIEGDAEEVLKTMAENRTAAYDLVFMDAAKAQYPNYLPYVKKLLRSGSVLLSDNVLFDGAVPLSRYMVERRNRTIHKRMRDYLFALTADGDFETSVTKIGDGLAVSVYR